MAQGRILGSKREKITGEEQCIMRRFVIGSSCQVSYFCHGAKAPSGSGPRHYRGFTITLRHSTLGRTPLGVRSARRRDLHLTTQYSPQTSMPPEGLEPAIASSGLPQTNALDHAVTGIGPCQTLG